VVSPSVTTTYTVNGTDANGCKNSDTISVMVNVCTGISTFALNDQLNIYPNPNSGSFLVELPVSAAVYQIEIVNALSQVIFNEKINASSAPVKKVITLNDAAKGIYTIRIQSGERELIRKMIIE
jgi:hypothetical protein